MDTPGRSQFEIIVSVETKLDQFLVRFQQHEVEVARELGKRPTRSELMAWFAGAGTLSGIIFSLLNLFIK